MAKKKSALESILWEPSEQLAEIVGDRPLPRSEVTKKIWAYIKKHKLQDENSKRDILPDDVLGEVLGHKKINMFKMTAKISAHLSRYK